ncbi:MAG: peptidylprolyl isomerase [Candidatus Latescibacterota bacterium]|jgi:parvulin-like peptidyl-prolyl isomerase
MNCDRTLWHQRNVWVLLVGVLGWGGCGEDPAQTPAVNILQGSKAVPDGMLAIVGDDGIVARELREYEGEIQTVHKSTKEGVEKYRDHLQSLIDEKLIVREAESRGLDADPALSEALKVTEHNAMVEAYLHANVGTNIHITEAELLENYNSHPARYAVKGAHILVATRAQADSLHRLIQSGQRLFEDLAREYSLDEKTADKGGVFDTYYAFDRVSDQVYSKVFSMETGHVSEPFRTPQGWELGKVVGKQLVPYEKYKPVIQRATMMKKFHELKKEHIDSLQYKLNLHPDAERLRSFIMAWNESPGRPNLTPEEFAAPLYIFDGGHITQDQAMYLLINTRLGESTVDSALVDERIRKQGAPDFLLAEVSRSAGFHEKESVREKVKIKRAQLLLEKMWNTELEGELEVSEKEARTHYDAHPGKYKIPEEIIIQEILVADRQQAEQLMTQIRAGEDMADLATRYSIRRYSDENGGLYAMRAFERMVYQELMDAAVKASMDTLLGPIEIKKPMMAIFREPKSMEKAYSIFKVLERLPERVQTYELSKDKAVFYARQLKQQQRVVELNEEFRRKFKEDWGIDEAALLRYAQSVQMP